jgi:hypothetical protein
MQSSMPLGGCLPFWLSIAIGFDCWANFDRSGAEFGGEQRVIDRSHATGFGCSRDDSAKPTLCLRQAIANDRASYASRYANGWGYLHSVKWLSKFPKENWYHECNLTETDVLIGKVRQSIAPNLAIKFESIDLLDLEDGVDVDRLARNVLWWRFINFCQKVDLASDIELVARNYGSIISCPLLFSLINI